MARTRVMQRSELIEWVMGLQPSMVVGILLAGDRIYCCDEAVGVEVDGKIVSVATIAPNGEQMSGEPTIVALYTMSEYRRKGYGKIALQAAIARCRKRGFSYARVDVISGHARRIIISLSRKEKKFLRVYEWGSSLDFIPE